MNGMDISSAKALYDNGSIFYNEDGVEQSLYYILKDAGFNWLRFKLFVNPYTNSGKSYGCGESDLNNTLWMVKEAKTAGFKVLLDFHYSDYWCHPGQQVLPKAWANATSATDLANKIRNYTYSTLMSFAANGCLPEMVQVGNEISSGNFLKLPGADSDTFNSYGEPQYITGAKTSFAYAGTAGSNYMNQYLNAAIEGVKNVNSNIKTVVHWAKGSNISADIIKNFFNGITAPYDYAGISFYPYHCFANINDAKSILNNLTTGNKALTKPWFVAETSYPYSGTSYVYENNYNVTNYTISDWTTSSGATYIDIKQQYSFNTSGQANLIHDLTEAVVNANGKGMFYWEGAWVPNTAVEWAGPGSGNSWCNQGFFSPNGKAISNIDLFKQLSPHI